jgi:hypothetical protein
LPKLSQIDHFINSVADETWQMQQFILCQGQDAITRLLLLDLALHLDKQSKSQM